MNNKILGIIFLLFLILIISIWYLFIKWNKETIKNSDNNEIVIKTNDNANDKKEIEKLDNTNKEVIVETETIETIETKIPQDIELLELENILWDKDKEFIEIIKSLEN